VNEEEFELVGGNAGTPAANLAKQDYVSATSGRALKAQKLLQN